MDRLLLWEPPLGEENSADGAEFARELAGVIAEGDPERTLRYFMQDMPPEWFEGMRASDHWPLFARMAPTALADAEALAWTQSEPRGELWQNITVPAFVLLGHDAPQFFHAAADSLVANLADARKCEVPGSGHSWPPDAMSGALIALLTC